jgi:hypothetical protein
LSKVIATATTALITTFCREGIDAACAKGGFKAAELTAATHTAEQTELSRILRKIAALTSGII